MSVCLWEEQFYNVCIQGKREKVNDYSSMSTSSLEKNSLMNENSLCFSLVVVVVVGAVVVVVVVVVQSFSRSKSDSLSLCTLGQSKFLSALE